MVAEKSPIKRQSESPHVMVTVKGKHCHHAKDEKKMSTELTRIGEKARKEVKLVFTSLYHHVSDIDNLRECYKSLEAYKAKGVDGMDKMEYGENLEANLKGLSDRLKRMGYRPQPKRRSYIPKPGSEKGRPLGISCFEDKVVELAVKRVLEPIFEPIFEECSHGYRPGRSPHTCIDALGRTIQQKRVSHIVEADIRSFFDKVNHEWLMKFMEQKIGDNRMLRLLWRMLKAGIMEDGLVKASEEGTPQGSILSPLLSNVYLHYVLDLWVQKRVRKESKGEVYYFRYADDFLACFQYQSDAEMFLKATGDRLEGFGLSLAMEKTRRISFGRFAREDACKKGENPEEFTFLGFTFYCGKTRNGHFKVKRKTSRKKLVLALRNFRDWARKAYWKTPKVEMIRQAKSKVAGHLNYYAITDNGEKCNLYIRVAERILLKWLNRKSQRKAYTWETFKQVLCQLKWPRLKIKEMSPFASTAAVH
jgi:RNA-directed DNA polymerase